MSGTPHSQLDISIFDRITIRNDLSASVVRRYTFTNSSNDSASIDILRTETFDCPVEQYQCSSEFVQILTAQSDPTAEVTWASSQPVRLEPDQNIVIESSFIRPFLSIVPPLTGSLEYASNERLLYSAEIIPHLKSLFPLSEITVQPTPLDSEMDPFTITEDGRLLISPRRISVNKSGKFALHVKCSPSGIETLELLRVLANRAKRQGVDLSELTVVLVLHLLTDSLSFIEALEQIGLNPRRTFIVGIPYSLKEHVVVRLQARGYGWIATPNDYPFNSDIERAIQAAEQAVLTNGGEIIVVEDGGYVIPRILTTHRHLVGKVKGGVEQTANGIWAYDKIRPEDITLPVMNVAESDLKKRRESPLIGEAVLRNVSRLLEESAARISIHGKEILVVGYGATGSEVAKKLRANDAKVSVFDEREDRRQLAQEDGFNVPDKLEIGISGKSLVVGCTGKVSIGINPMLRATHRTYFVNASSKRLEVDHDELPDIADTVVTLPGVGVQYNLVNKKEITILANGFPVNFHGKAESVPDKEIQFIYGLLFQSVVQLMTESLNPGLVEIPSDIQEFIEQLHDALLSNR